MLPVIDALKIKNRIKTKPTAKPINLKMLKPFLNINISPKIIIDKQCINCQENHIFLYVILTISSVSESIFTFSLTSSPAITKTLSPATKIGILSLNSKSTLLFVK